jgi:hypothetical protein
MAYDRVEPMGFRGLEEMMIRAVGAIRGGLGVETNEDLLRQRPRSADIEWPTEEEIRKATQKTK